MKIAIVRMTAVFDQSQRAKALTMKLRATADKWQDQLSACHHKLNETIERQNKIGASATKDVAFKLQRDRTVLELEARSVEERMRVDVDSHREHYRSQLLEELRQLVHVLAQERQLDAVLPIDGENDVSFVAPAIDLTEEVIKRFDAAGR